MKFIKSKFILSWALSLIILLQPLIIQSAYAKKPSALKKAAVKILKIGTKAADTVKDKLGVIKSGIKKADKEIVNGIKKTAKDKITNTAETEAKDALRNQYVKDKENVEEANKKFNKLEKISKFIIDTVKFIKKWVLKPSPGKLITKTIDFVSLASGFEAEKDSFVESFLEDSSVIAEGAYMAGLTLNGMALLCSATGALLPVGALCATIGTEMMAIYALITTTIATVKGAIYVGKVANDTWATSVSKANSLWDKWFGEKEVKELPVDDIKDTGKEEVTIEPPQHDTNIESDYSNTDIDMNSEFGADEPMLPLASTERSSNSGQADVAGLAAAEAKEKAMEKEQINSELDNDIEDEDEE